MYSLCYEVAGGINLKGVEPPYNLSYLLLFEKWRLNLRKNNNKCF